MPRRRLNGEGTIYQRPNGLWVCEITLGYDDAGKRIKKTLSSMELEKLKKKINDTKYLNDRAMITNPTDYSVSDWVLFYLENYKKNSVKPHTYECYYYAWKNHIKESLLGKSKLEKLNQLMVQNFVNDLHQKGYALSTIKKAYIALNLACKKAVQNNYLYKNPCTDIDFPRSAPRQVLAMTVEEQAQFEAHCPENTFGNLFLFALNTGMRLGEMLALTWNDIDFDNGVITVEKTAGLVMNPDTHKAEMMIDTAKTESSQRVIPMSKTAREILCRQRSLDDVLCFPSTTGTILYGRNVRRAFEKALKSAGIETHYTIHSLRHTFATRLLEKGANIKAISEILGHKSIQITLDIYSHVGVDFKKETIDLLDS